MQLGREHNGRPVVLVPATRSVTLSLSHTARYLAIAVLAVHRDRPPPRLGIDIEPCEGRPVSAQLLPWLAPHESAAVAAAAEDHRRLAFLGVWTQKEAYLKALGRGVDSPLADFEVQTDMHADAAVTRAASWSGAESLSLYRLRGSGWVGALASDHPEAQLHVQTLSIPQGVP